ncbi:Toxin HigB-1 [compost metagenome]
MVRTFLDPETEALFRRTRQTSLPADLQRVALRKLALLDSAIRLSDLERLPANRLHTLAGGSHKGLHEVAIADGWTLRFRWMDGDAYKVELVAPRLVDPGGDGP